MKEYKLYINGEHRSSSSGTIIDSINPTDGSVFARVHMADKSDIELAIASAYKAQKKWAKTTPREKEAVLLRAADIFDSRHDEIQEILMKESGSTLAKCNFEIGVVSDILRVAAGEARRVNGETFVSNDENVFSYSLRRPVGVIAGISPFNAPMILSSKKFAFAIAAGNSFVLKPSSQVPVTGLVFGEIFKEAGLPDGVLNIIPCSSKDLGETFQEDKRISMITFTGSTKVGTKIAESAAKYMKKCTFELGGKSPVIVLEDADVKYAVDTAFFGTFMHQGQICMAGTRVIVHERLYDEFVEMFAKKVETLHVGDPSDPKTVIGPLIEEKQCSFIDGLVADAEKKGARVLSGGVGTSKGCFYQPTTVVDVTPEMELFKTEAFGPVVAITKARDIDHAIELANDSDYGLSSTVVTDKIEYALRCAEEIESGMVHINGPTLQDEAHIPFGGVKMSGLGREGGRFAIEEMTELKWVTMEALGNHKYPF